MNKYDVDVITGAGMVRYYIIADDYRINDTCIHFELVTGTTVAVFPSRLTIIAKIEKYTL